MLLAGKNAIIYGAAGVAEVASVAAFLASERASAMTAAIANVTCGELLDLSPTPLPGRAGTWHVLHPVPGLSSWSPMISSLGPRA